MHLLNRWCLWSEVWLKHLCAWTDPQRARRCNYVYLNRKRATLQTIPPWIYLAFVNSVWWHFIWKSNLNLIKLAREPSTYYGSLNAVQNYDGPKKETYDPDTKFWWLGGSCGYVTPLQVLSNTATFTSFLVFSKTIP